MGEQEAKLDKVTAGQAEPELLYHYTNGNGLHGILRDKCIWATHYRFLNDSTERQLGLDAYKDTIFRVASERFGAPEPANTLIDYFQRRSTDVLNAYTVSFCASYTKEEYENVRQTGAPPTEDGRGGDRLSQWRGYAPGVQGYCLAFDFDLARQIQRLSQNRCYHSFCNYSHASIGQLAETHVREMVESVLRCFTTDDFISLESLHAALNRHQAGREKMTEFIVDVLLLCGVFKHDGFQEENEYRLLKFMFQCKPSSEELHFRSGSIPYIEIPLNLVDERSPLRAIFVGPSANMDMAAYGLQLRLKEMGLSQVEVVPSKIPYRNW